MSNLENQVIDYFSQFCVVVSKIPESDEKTPDFLIDQEERVLIELKEKKDKEELHESKESVLSEGEIYEHFHTMGHNKRISGVISYGIKQLATQKENTKSDFCFLFLVANGVSPSNQIEKVYSTLYGKMEVIDFESKSNIALRCYYAYYSEFYKYRDVIDGVFLAGNGSVRLLLNDKSPRYLKLKESKFITKFVESMHIHDPVELEKRNEILIADCEISRGNTDAVKDYVFSKYGIKRGMMLDFPHITLESRIEIDKT